MDLTTVSSVLNVYERLEDQTAKFYEELAENDRYSKEMEMFLDLAKDSRRQKDRVLRAYRECVTDILEVGFSLTGLREVDYQLKRELNRDASLNDVLRAAIDLEENGRRFCQDVSSRGRALLADISREFERAARRKEERKVRLESLLN